MTVAEFETIALNISVPLLIGYMLYIIYKLGKESKAGKFGFMVLFGVLAFGIFGFCVKFLIKIFLLKQ